MNEKLPYEPPAISDIGTVHEFTLQSLNKMGRKTDVYSSIVPIVGSLRPSP